jgi:hypothetical protein
VTPSLLLLLVVGLSVLPQLSTAANASSPLFSSCESDPWPRDFETLKASPAIAQIEEISHCMRLTNSQYLIAAIPAGPASNLYFCDLAAQTPTCVEDRDGVYYPNLEIVRQFIGSNGKRYVLWESSMLRHGLMSSNYHVFSLVPRSKAPRGYEFYSLDIGNAASGEDGKCRSDLNLDEAVLIQSVDVLNEGTEHVLIRFGVTTTACDTEEMNYREVDYSLVDGKFASTIRVLE